MLLVDRLRITLRLIELPAPGSCGRVRPLRLLADPAARRALICFERSPVDDAAAQTPVFDLRCPWDAARTHAEPGLCRRRGWFYDSDPEWIGVCPVPETSLSALLDLVRCAQRILASRIDAPQTIVVDHADFVDNAAPVVVDPPELRPFPFADDLRVRARPGRAAGRGLPASPIPEPIRRMMALYVPGSARVPGGIDRDQRLRNFLRQAQAMKDYEDDAPESLFFDRPLPSYHDMSLPQLRWYFTWRTQARKGRFLKVAPSMLVLHAYELMNGIGAADSLEAIERLERLQREVVDAGLLTDPSAARELKEKFNRWRLALGVLCGAPPERLERWADPRELQLNRITHVLTFPDSRTDEEILDALDLVSKGRMRKSASFERHPQKAARFYSFLWRRASACSPEGRQLMHAKTCGWFFTQPGRRRWDPFFDALVSERVFRRPRKGEFYVLAGCWRFEDGGGFWWEQRCGCSVVNHERIRALLHEAERVLRAALGVGRALKALPETDWLRGCVESCAREWLENEEKRRSTVTAACGPLSAQELERIRRDAEVIRESLLTDEEREPQPQAEAAEVSRAPAAAASAGMSPAGAPAAPFGLDAVHLEILQRLLAWGDARDLVRAHHLMAAAAADTINEALLEVVGDSVVVCDNDALSLVEDYRGELADLLGTKQGSG